MFQQAPGDNLAIIGSFSKKLLATFLLSMTKKKRMSWLPRKVLLISCYFLTFPWDAFTRGGHREELVPIMHCLFLTKIWAQVEQPQLQWMLWRKERGRNTFPRGVATPESQAKNVMIWLSGDQPGSFSTTLDSVPYNGKIKRISGPSNYIAWPSRSLEYPDQPNRPSHSQIHPKKQRSAGILTTN